MKATGWWGAVAGLLLAATPAAAQAPAEDPACRYDGRCTVWWAEEVAVLGGNVLLGGLTAGIWQELRGGSFADGFSRGALGGAIGYGGKRLASARAPMAGLLGRQLAAVGHSVVRNAAEGRPTFGRVALPLLFLPARLQLGDWGRDLPVRVDALALWFFGYGLFSSELSFDLGRSLSWGAATFVADDHLFSFGGGLVSSYPAAGAIYVNREMLSLDLAGRIVAHERVHFAQIDYLILTMADPADDWLESVIPPLGRLSRFVAPNVLALGLALPQYWLQTHVVYGHLPWELEAMALTGQTP